MKKEISGYWLQCKCGYEGKEYQGVTGCKSAGAYIWNKVRGAKWDQALLRMKCPKCNRRSLRITYAFPRKNREVVQVIHIVGISLGNDYTPVLWESRAINSAKQWFQFNFLNGGPNPWGLNKAAVLSYAEMRKLFALYRSKTGRQLKTS